MVDPLPEAKLLLVKDLPFRLYLIYKCIPVEKINQQSFSVELSLTISIGFDFSVILILKDWNYIPVFPRKFDIVSRAKCI